MKRLSSQYLPLVATVVVFVLLYAAASAPWAYPKMFSWQVFGNLLRDNAVAGIVAIGMTFVILSGGIDLSVGAVVGFTTILIAALVTQFQLHPLAAFAVALAIGAIYGVGVGSIVHYFALPSFLVTLSGMFLMRGLGYVVSLKSISINHGLYKAASNFGFEQVPIETIVLLTIMLLALYVAHFTRFGRNVYAIGGNAQSALLMGLPVARTTVGIYALSGLCAATAGIVSSLNAQSGDPQAGTMLELDAIAAVVIGGTLLSGGVGYVAGTLVGVLILGTIQTIITFQGNLNPSWTRIGIGLLLLAFIVLQRLFQGRPRQ